MPDEFEVKNVNEEIIDALLEEYVEKSDMCKCNRCMADVRAYVLNQISPRYVVTMKGYAHSRMQAATVQSNTDFISVIVKGIELVKSRPNH